MNPSHPEQQHAPVEPTFWGSRDITATGCGWAIWMRPENKKVAVCPDELTTDKLLALLNSEAAATAELRAKIASLEAELESHAWKVSPAMAQAKIDELNRKVAEAEKDKARLDWLEATTALPSYPPAYNCAPGAKGRFHLHLDGRHIYETSYRQAIDAAMSPPPQECPMPDSTANETWAETVARWSKEDVDVRAKNGPGCIWPSCTCGKYQPGCAAKLGANPYAGLPMPPWATGGIFGVIEH